MTPEDMFESFRRASVATMQMQQEMFKQWTQQFPAAPLNVAGVSMDWVQSAQKRWAEFTLESLESHRQSLDSVYKSLTKVIEQALRLGESKSPEEYRRTAEELRTKVFETFKDQSETQFREFVKSAEKWLDVLPKA